MLLSLRLALQCLVNAVAHFVPLDLYGILPRKSPDLPSKFKSLFPVPITVINASKPGFQASDLAALVANFTSSDDVF
jgi:hypothetical protein